MADADMTGFYNNPFESSDTIDFGQAIPSGSSGSLDIGYDLGSGITAPVIDNGVSGYYGTEDTSESWLDAGTNVQTANGGMSTSSDSLLGRLLGNDNQSVTAQDQSLVEKAQAAFKASQGGDKGATDWLANLSKTLGGDKAVAALIQGGFGMLSGYSNGKMLEEKMKNDRRTRDEEWARKDSHAYAGKVQPMKFGLLGSASK